MKQLTEAQAIEIFKSDVWKEWSLEYVAKFQLYQRRLCVPFSLFHQAMEQELGRSVWTHEFAFYDNIKEEYEKKRKKPSFQEILELIPEEKRIIINVDIE